MLPPAAGRFALLRRGRSAGAPPPLAGVRSPVDTRRAGNAAATWSRAATAISHHTFGHGPDAVTAAAMLANQLAGSTRDTYATKWGAFVDFCQASGFPSLPTTTEVGTCYVGELYERGTIAPGTIQSFLTPINSVHALLQLTKPAVGPLLKAVRHGFAHLHADANGGLRDKRIALPAAVLVRLGQSTTDVSLRRRMAGLALEAMKFARPSRGANLRIQEVTLSQSHLLVQVANYKHGARANRERLVIRAPRRAAGAADAPYNLVHCHVTAMTLAGAAPDQHLFTPIGDKSALPTEVATAWLREALYLIHEQAPDGCISSWHSLRAGAATSARAVGCPVDAIATLMGMRNKSTTTVLAHYVDALAEPDDACRELYDRYVVARL